KKKQKDRVNAILARQDEDLDHLDDDVVEEEHILSGGNGNSQGVVSGQAKKRKAADNTRGPFDRLLTVDVEKMKQANLDRNNPHKKTLKKKTWIKIAKWAYEVGLPFNVVRTSSFKDAVHAIGEYERSGYYLNPKIYFSETKAKMELNKTIKSGFFQAVAKLIPESDIQKAMDELKHYRDAEGSFGMKAAIVSRDTMQPRKLYNLILTCKKKRFKERLANGESDPIILKEVHENDAWIIPNEEQLEEFVREGDDLSWDQVLEVKRVGGATTPSTRSETGTSFRVLYEEDEDIDIEIGDL
ncbi:hypothetical protein IFM89_011987, partial [Coptis chinensis]